MSIGYTIPLLIRSPHKAQLVFKGLVARIQIKISQTQFKVKDMQMYLKNMFYCISHLFPKNKKLNSLAKTFKTRFRLKIES